MDRLLKLHQGAIEVDLATAEGLAQHDRNIYRMGPLLITSVHLEDVGLKGRTDKSNIPQEETYEVEDVSEALSALGLPTSFGQKASNKKQAAHRHAPVEPVTELSAEELSGMTWQQLEMLFGPGGADKVLAAAKTNGSSATVASTNSTRSGRHKKTPTMPEGLMEAAKCVSNALRAIPVQPTSDQPTEQPCPPSPPQALPPAPPPPVSGPVPAQHMPPPLPFTGAALARTPPPPLHPALAALPAAAMQWQQLHDPKAGLFYFNLVTLVSQAHAPQEGFVPLHLKEDADIVRGIPAGAGTVQPHMHHGPPPLHMLPGLPPPAQPLPPSAPTNKKIMTLEELERELAASSGPAAALPSGPPPAQLNGLPPQPYPYPHPHMQPPPHGLGHGHPLGHGPPPYAPGVPGPGPIPGHHPPPGFPPVHPAAAHPPPGFPYTPLPAPALSHHHHPPPGFGPPHPHHPPPGFPPQQLPPHAAPHLHHPPPTAVPPPHAPNGHPPALHSNGSPGMHHVSNGSAASRHDRYLGSQGAATAPCSMEGPLQAFLDAAERPEPGARVILDPNTAAYVRTMLPRNVAKYWLQRYSLFSKYDQGIQMDTEGWWSVTPEVLARHQSAQCKRYSGGMVALDAMAGCGGNAIAMTHDYACVYAVELSQRRPAMIHHNACIYGVQSKVEVLCNDFFLLAPRLVADVIFVSPPWGGPKYKWCDTFPVLEAVDGLSFSIQDLLQACLTIVKRSMVSYTHRPAPALQFMPGKFDLATLEASFTSNAAQQTPPPVPVSNGNGHHANGHVAGPGAVQGVVALFLPRNTDLWQLASLVPSGGVWQVERNYVNKRLKGITFYCFAT